MNKFNWCQIEIMGICRIIEFSEIPPPFHICEYYSPGKGIYCKYYAGYKNMCCNNKAVKEAYEKFEKRNNL